MPVAHITFGNIGKEAVLSTDFNSAELDSGSNYTFANVSGNYAVVTAIGVDIYVAFTSNGSVPVTSTNPRIRIPAGSFMPFSIRNGVRIGVVAAS